MADLAFSFFIKVVDNLLRFLEHLESSQLDICSSRYRQFTLRCSPCIFTNLAHELSEQMNSEFDDQV